MGGMKTGTVIDLHRTLAHLHQTQTSISLSTTDLCFLLALRTRADRESLASFEEEILIDVFLQICELTEPGAENPRKRATHAIQRLRDQRFLARVDGAGFVRAGEYAMTRLAAAIVDFFLADEALTRESLTLLTKTLLSHLAALKKAASQASQPEDWKREIIEPLRITVGDLVGGIERRQRGLDAQQEEIRERIGTLLKRDWFAAVDMCEQLLEDTTTTLRELNEVLLQDTATSRRCSRTSSNSRRTPTPPRPKPPPGTSWSKWTASLPGVQPDSARGPSTISTSKATCETSYGSTRTAP